MSLTGSDTSAINQFRQGVHAFGNFERRGMLPVLAPEVDGTFMSQSIFGQPKTYPDAVAFEDLADFDPVVFINDENGTQTFPAFLGNVNLRDPGQMDGVLEPLGIRGKVSMTSIDFPFEGHDIRGNLQDGNEDVLRRNSQISNFYPVDRPLVITPFYDADEYFGSTSQTAVRLPGVFPDEETRVHPYEDPDAIEFDKLGVTVTGDDIIGVLESMNPATEDLLPNDNKSLGAGFTYDNNVAGTDSLAFGGFTK